MSYSPPRVIRYLFIDGGCLRETVRSLSEKWANGQTLELQYTNLTSNFTKVFYYDALPRRRENEQEAEYLTRISGERRLLDELSQLDRFHVYEGDVRRSSARRGPEQKKVDVMIAVDMLSHTFRRNMQEATLLTSDLDFRPLIDALVQEGMEVTLWYPPGDTTRDLIVAADRRRVLDVQTINAALTPESRKVFSYPHIWDSPHAHDFGPAIWVSSCGMYSLLHSVKEFTLVAPSARTGYKIYCQHRELAGIRIYSKEAFAIDIPKGF